MKILLALLTVLFVFAPNPAQASFWFECKVMAVVSKTDKENIYKADIQSAVVVGGHTTNGEQCMIDNIGKVIEIPIGGDVPIGKAVRLKYQFFNMRTEDGVSNGETWEYWPWLFKELLPW